MKPFKKLVIGLALSFAFVVNCFGQLSWQPTNSLDSFMVNSLLSQGNDLYAGMMGAGVFKTNDEGETWEACNNGLTNPFPRCFANKGNTLYVGTDGGGVFKSSNKGESWQSASDTTLNLGVWSLAVKGNRLFAGTRGGVYYSDNGGDNWTKANLPIHKAHHQIIFSLAVKGNKVVAGSNRYIFLSEDGGTSWQQIKLDTKLDIVTTALHGNLILLGTSGDGIFASSDGIEWTSYDGKNANVRDMLVLADNSLLTGVSLEGVIKDTTSMNEGFMFPQIKSVTFHKGKFYAGTFYDGVFRYDIPPTNLIPPTTNKLSWTEARIFPNPTGNGLVTLEYKLEELGEVNIQLYNSSGILLAEVFDSKQGKGVHQINYDLSQYQGGTYYFTLQVGKEKITKPVIVLR